MYYSMRMFRGLVFMLLLFISLVPLQSNASDIFRKLAEDDNDNPKVSPSPGPVLSITPSSGGAPIDNSGNIWAEPNVTETCESVSNTCRKENMTACIPYPTSGPKGSFLLILNDGENPLKVKVIILPVNKIYKPKDIPGHQAKKMNISAIVGRSSSLVLNAGNGDCVIHMGAPAPAPQDNNLHDQFPAYATYVTPINGIYLLFSTALIVAGMWGCCKLGKGGRHLDGVPYQELEMGQPESISSMNGEMAEGWNQGWDDDWDEEKAVKSPDGNHVGTRPANGITSRSPNSEGGWGNGWKD